MSSLIEAPWLAPGMAETLAEDERLKQIGDDAVAAYWAEGAAEVPVEDVTFEGAVGQTQNARIYRGAAAGAPVLLYIHGGGWVTGSIALNERACRTIAAESGWNVVSISYRLAPEHPFPAGLDDCRAAFKWLRANADTFGFDPGRIAMGGASAGANLALAVALSEDRTGLAGLLLFYGVFGSRTDTASYMEHAKGPGLTRERVEEIFGLYDPQDLRHGEPLIAPVLGDLAGLPPVCLIAAQIDVLRSDSELLAARLGAANVAATLHVEPGVTHGFINRGRLLPAARDCLTRASAFLSGLEVRS